MSHRTNEHIDMCLPTRVITFHTHATSHVRYRTCVLLHYTRAYPCHVRNLKTSHSLTHPHHAPLDACAQLIQIYSHVQNDFYLVRRDSVQQRAPPNRDLTNPPQILCEVPRTFSTAPGVSKSRLTTNSQDF